MLCVKCAINTIFQHVSISLPIIILLLQYNIKYPIEIVLCYNFIIYLVKIDGVYISIILKL